MPATVEGNIPRGTSAALLDADYNRIYRERYPFELDLKPGSDLHDEIRDEILTRARQAHMAIEDRFDAWDRIEQTLQVYIPKTDEEELIKDEDTRKPVSIVVPISFATLETLMTYWTSAFLDLPMFRYRGFGPGDDIKAALMQLVVELQSVRYKHALDMYVLGRDGFTYGFGALAPVWTQSYEYRPVAQDEGMVAAVKQLFQRFGTFRDVEEYLAFEGNELMSIRPHLFLPDPNVSIHEIQKGEFVGWLDRTNYYNLLSLDTPANNMFNVRYLKHIDGRSKLYTDVVNNEARTEEVADRDMVTSTKPMDCIWMYVTIIPKEWKLGDNEMPEKWLFGVAGDQVVISATPMSLNHNRYPVVTVAPDFDGYSIAPLSRLEVLDGMQEAVNWLWNSHIYNVRRVLNDLLLIDPSMVFMSDLERSDPGGFVRLRKRAWGLGNLDQVVKQIPMSDVTRQNVQDMLVMQQMIQNVGGTTDPIQGVLNTRGERRSAAEASQAARAALSRLQKTTRICGWQGMYDLAYMVASQTQQLMERGMYVRIAGEWEDLLRKQYKEDEFVKVAPRDVSMSYDVIPTDGSVPDGTNSETWVQLFQIIGSQPELAAMFDTTRIFKHIARLLGAKDLEKFVRKQPFDTQIVPNEQARNMAADGQVVPLERAGMR